MSYVDHLGSENTPPRKRWTIDTGRLTQVTTVSKVFAIILFILLPFGGFWLGMHYAPVVYVEAPTMYQHSTNGPAVDNDDVDDDENDTSDLILREYNDPDAGISFMYPVEWGVITTGTENGECPQTYTDDSCTMRTYHIQNPDTGNRAVFLVTATEGHGYYPMPRGAFWGDFVHAQNEAWQTICAQQSSQCSLFENRAGVTMAAHVSGAEIDASIHGVPARAGWYYTEVGGRNYTRFALSPVELGWVSVDPSVFRETVVETLTIQ